MKMSTAAAGVFATSEAEIRDLVDEGGKLHREIAALEAKQTRLNSIKSILRELADGKEMEFKGARYTAQTKNKPDSVCRQVEDSKVKRIVKMAAESLFTLFKLVPIKGTEKNFEMNALKNLPKKTAMAMIEELKVETTPWVLFS